MIEVNGNSKKITLEYLIFCGENRQVSLSYFS